MRESRFKNSAMLLRYILKEEAKNEDEHFRNEIEESLNAISDDDLAKGFLNYSLKESIG